MPAIFGASPEASTCGSCPFADFVNGDMLTVEMSAPGEPHPVRYFSHNLEGLHGLTLAPD